MLSGVTAASTQHRPYPRGFASLRRGSTARKQTVALSNLTALALGPILKRYLFGTWRAVVASELIGRNSPNGVSGH